MLREWDFIACVSIIMDVELMTLRPLGTPPTPSDELPQEEVRTHQPVEAEEEAQVDEEIAGGGGEKEVEVGERAEGREWSSCTLAPGTRVLL